MKRATGRSEPAAPAPPAARHAERAIAFFDLHAMMDQRERPDITPAADTNDPTERTEPAEPMLPTESTEPMEAMDNTELREPIDSTESRDQSDQREP